MKVVAMKEAINISSTHCLKNCISRMYILCITVEQKTKATVHSIIFLWCDYSKAMHHCNCTLYVTNRQAKKIYLNLKVAPACIHALGRYHLLEISGQVTACFARRFLPFCHSVCVSHSLAFFFTSVVASFFFFCCVVLPCVIIKVAQSVFCWQTDEIVVHVVERLNFSEL